MQESLKVLTSKCEEIDFTVSQNKTKVMAKTRSIPPNKLQIQGRNIEWVATHSTLASLFQETRHGMLKCNT